MSRTVKIAISLPGELLDSAERARRACGETRSEFFRRAVEALLLRQEQQTAVNEYVEAYRRQPETVEEQRIATQQASAVLALEPWE
jgi:metal-responsive CopG/Arc/MetJ family transcriptional regulator